MGGEQKQKRKFDPKKGGCRDMQKATCEGGVRPTCLAGEDEKKRCKDKQPRLCEGKKEPLCSDGTPMMRPKPPSNKAIRFVCKDKGEPACADKSTSACSDGSKDDFHQCNAPWLCADKSREVCPDGSFPKMVAKKDKKKQGWNKPVRKPKLSRDDFKNEDLDEATKEKAIAASESILDHLVTNAKERNKTRDNLKKATLLQYGIVEKEDEEEEIEWEE